MKSNVEISQLTQVFSHFTDNLKIFFSWHNYEGGVILNHAECIHLLLWEFTKRKGVVITVFH